MLTKKQAELLAYINGYVRQNGGVSPSFQEMANRLGFRGKSGVHRIVTALERRGFVRRVPNRARGIEVIRIPDALGGVSLVADERERCANIVLQVVEPGPLRALLLKMIREGASVAAGRAVV